MTQITEYSNCYLGLVDILDWCATAHPTITRSFHNLSLIPMGKQVERQLIVFDFDW